MGKKRPIKDDEWDDIFDRICNGQSVRSILSDLGINGFGALYAGMEEDATGERVKRYTRALKVRAESFADEIIEVARNRPGITECGAVDSGEVQHRKLLIDTLKWTAARMNPKRYSERYPIQEEQEDSIAADTIQFYLPKNGREPVDGFDQGKATL